MNRLQYIPEAHHQQELERIMCEPKSKELKGTGVGTGDGGEKKFRKEDEKESKPLGKQQLAALVSRLTKTTKKQYEIRQQTVHILHLNKELQQKRLTGDKVENRLMAFGRERDRKVLQQGQDIQKQAKERYCRDIPQITQKGHSVKQPVIERRLNKVISTQEHHKQELLVKYQPSFRPDVDPHSEFINDIENLGDLYNRMNAKEKQADKRKAKTMKKVVEEEKRQLTFKPKINQKSREIAETLPPRSIPGTPFQRSHSHSQESEVPQFAPTINRNTDRFLRNREKEDCFRRLYKQAKQQSIKKTEQVQQRDRMSSFQPTLNSKSLKMANSRLQKTKTEGKVCALSIEDDQSFEEIKIGKEAGCLRSRTYSLRGSTVHKGHWIEQLEPPASRRDLTAHYKTKIGLMR